ncbi:MAG: hypothetical protein WAM14_18855, partial [Candidatus Nitrosopolaris sp.]
CWLIGAVDACWLIGAVDACWLIGAVDACWLIGETGAEFLEMPGRLARLEQHMEDVLKLVKQQEKSSEDKSGGIMAEGKNT